MGSKFPFNGYLAIGNSCGRNVSLEAVFSALSPAMASSATLSLLSPSTVLIGCRFYSDLVNIVKDQFFLVEGGFFEVKECILSDFNGTNCELERRLFWNSVCLNRRNFTYFLHSDLIEDLPKPPPIRFLPRSIPSLILKGTQWPNLGVKLADKRNLYQQNFKENRCRSSQLPMRRKNFSSNSKRGVSVSIPVVSKSDATVLNKDDTCHALIDFRSNDYSIEGSYTDLPLNNGFSPLEIKEQEVFVDIPTPKVLQIHETETPVLANRVLLRGSEYRSWKHQLLSISRTEVSPHHNLEMQPVINGEASRMRSSPTLQKPYIRDLKRNCNWLFGKQPKFVGEASYFSQELVILQQYQSSQAFLSCTNTLKVYSLACEVSRKMEKAQATLFSVLRLQPSKIGVAIVGTSQKTSLIL